MAYSSIKRKMCKGCFVNYPKIGLAGFCSTKCMPEEMQQLPKYKKGAVADRSRAKLNDISKKVKGYAKEQDAFKKPEINPQEAWYQERRKEMTGCCIECGRGTNVKDDKYYRWSVCHIVPKGLVPSVATHEYNWIELCQHHHQEFDNTFDRAAKMNCFGEAKMKFQLFKKQIPAAELRKVNPHLID